MKLLTWPKDALEAGIDRYSRAGMIVFMGLGIVVSVIEILLHVLFFHSTPLLILFWLGVVITGWLSDNYRGYGILVYTLGAWLPYLVFITLQILTAIFH